jgi:hypothetical protein
MLLFLLVFFPTLGVRLDVVSTVQRSNLNDIDNPQKRQRFFWVCA